MKFVHFTDTHLLQDLESTNLKPIFEKLSNHNEKFKQALIDLVLEDVEFISITGDLIHEGSVEEYAELKKLLDTYVPNTPVFLTLGNHDVKENFNKVFLGKEHTNAYYYVKNLENYRVVVLDSAIIGEHSGAIQDEQLQWLEQTLAENYQHGTLVFMHHPIVWEEEAVCMENAKKLTSILTNSDTIGVFTGHTHMNGLHYIEHIPQFTAEGVAFGLVKEKDNCLSLTNQSGYNVYTVKNKLIEMKRSQIKPDLERLYTVKYEQAFRKHATENTKV
ncbi:Icc protein [Neobacillus niacini]|uniref:metallophosphoesterase family protein n=1 Tax=Neobacillus niacini TaxID=86668 RepID=UPI00278B3300|nr:metallophosphoesterase [Neobacillus niacini]MDQ1005246.1 Icc protein [Neobacillus niacini]